MPFFSIVIPAFNRRDLLEETLSSLNTQTFQDFEIVVIDDGSTDGTATFLQQLGAPIRHETIANSGPGEARNCGIRQAKGDYIVFLDCDDLLLPGALATYQQVIEREDPSLIMGSALEFTEDHPELPSEVELDYQVLDSYLESSQHPLDIAAGRIVVKRRLLTPDRCFTSKRVNSEDHDFLLRNGDLPTYIRMEQPVTIAYRRHDESETLSSSGFIKCIEGLNFIVASEKHGNYPGGTHKRSNRERIIGKIARPNILEAARRKMKGLAA